MKILKTADELRQALPELPDSANMKPPFYDAGLSSVTVALNVSLPAVAWTEIFRYADAEETSLESAVALLAQEAGMDWNRNRRILERYCHSDVDLRC